MSMQRCRGIRTLVALRSGRLNFRWLVAPALVVALGASLAWGQGPVPDGFEPYALKHRQAADLAPQLRNMLQGLPEKTNVLIDNETNRLLVQGSGEAQKVAAQFVGALDRPVAAAPSESTAQSQVQGYRVPPNELQPLVARLQNEFGNIKDVRIGADDRTGQVIVVAPEEIQKKVLDRLRNAVPQAPPAASPATAAVADPVAGVAAPQQAPASTESLTYQLKNVSWRELEDELKSTWGSQLAVNTARGGEVATVDVTAAGGVRSVLEIDRRTDIVRLAGTSDSRVWLDVVKALDSPRTNPNEQTRLVPVKKADPNQVRSAVQLIRAASTAGGETTSAAKTLHGKADGPRWGGELVSMLFQEAAPAGAPPAPAAPAPAVPAPEAGAAAPEAAATPAAADAAPQAAAGGITPSEEGGLIGPVQIEFLEGLDVIVVKGNKRDVNRVMQIIADIEKISDTTTPVVDVYTLKHVNGESLVTLITELYTEILSARQGQVSVRALVDPNAVLLIGRKESVAVVKELIAKLDQPSDPSFQFKIFKLKYMAAVDAETAVRNFFVAHPGTDTQPLTGLGTQVRILADYRSNSLIVQASPRDLLEVKRMIEGIDVEDHETSAVIRVFRLKNALAGDLAQVIQGAITGQSATSGQAGQIGQTGMQGGATSGTQGGATQSRANMPSAVLEFMMVDQEGGRLLRSGVLTNVQVTSDPNINALVVRAPTKSMDLIAALIEQLDQVPDAESQIKVFTVVNGDATNLTALLQQLFGQQVTAGVGTTGGLFGNNFGQLGQTQLQTGASAGESSLVPLRFAVDVRTNSIIASGSEGDLNVVEALLLRLDEGDIETRKLTVIRLKNAPAQDVANSITQFLSNQRQLIQQQLLFNQAISPFEQIEREVIVVPELVTNSLIVSATPRYYDEILQVIQDLDFRPPMVMVQVLIAEVQLDELFEFGVEWGLQDSLLFDRGIAGTASNPGFNFLGGGTPGLPNLNSAGRGIVAGRGISSLGMGATNSTLGAGGMVLSAASDSVNFLVRALQDSGRLQILSRPQVMTLNNQQAFVQVGQTQSRITGSTVSQGIVQNNVTDVDTGLILRIQPLINDDGIIVMNVDAERSKLGNEADGPVVAFGPDNEPIRSPPIDRTTAQTTVSARSGQTVVFAGLITKDKIANITRVPYLSDIPVLGKLFQFERNAEQRRELLIVMTPYIIQSDEDYEWVKVVESERMSWCLADVVQVHGDVGMQGSNCMFCNQNIPVMYPDAAPLGTDIPPGTAEAGQQMQQMQMMRSPTPLPPSTMLRQNLSPVPQGGPGTNDPPQPDANGAAAPTPAAPTPPPETSMQWPAPGRGGANPWPQAEVVPAQYTTGVPAAPRVPNRPLPPMQ